MSFLGANYRSQVDDILDNVNRKIRIVQAIQCYNEEAFIGYTLQSIYDEVDRIIVVEGAVANRMKGDSPRSQDDTVEIINHFKRNNDPANKVTLIQMPQPFDSLETMKQVFLNACVEGDWVLINDCLTGDRCVPVKIDGVINILSLEELFQCYLDRGYKTYSSNNKECIKVDNLETLSVTDVHRPEHTLYSEQRGIELSPWFKTQLKESHLERVILFESGKLVCPDNDSRGTAITKYAHKKLKTIINAKAKWEKVSVISRCKTKRDIVRISHKYGETECTSDHRVAVKADGLKFKEAEKFSDPPLQIGEVPNDSILNSIQLSDWIDMSNFQLKMNKIHYLSSYQSNRWPWIYDKISNHCLENFCKLLGFYVAEGSVDSKQLKDLRICGLEDDVHKYHEYLLDISNHKHHFGFSRKKNGNIVHYADITSPVIIRIFAQLCGIGSHNKKIPEFIFHLEDRFKLAFLEGYNNGDGHDTPFGNTNISDTVSSKLHGGLCLLLKQLNKQYSISHRDSDQYNDEFNHSRVFTLSKDTQLDQVTRGKLKNINLGPTSNYVYDLTIPDTHNFCDADGLIIVHNCDEFYKPEDIKRLRIAIDRYPLAREIVPLFLHFWRDFGHIKIPVPEWQPQHQRFFKYQRGMQYKSHPIVTDPQGHCTYFSPHYQPRRFLLNQFYVWHYGYARPNLDELMQAKQRYYQEELAKFAATQEFDAKVLEFLNRTERKETVASYPLELHPEVMRTHPLFDHEDEHLLSLEDLSTWDLASPYREDIAGEDYGNIWLWMSGVNPRMSFYHNGIRI